jgi:nucleoside-diphosphate-sugar epimerase
MNILVIGGTGLIGSETARVLIARGHAVRTLALPPAPQGAPLPAQMAITFANYMELGEAELARHLAGCDGLVFAAGIDERIEGPPPIYALFEKHNLAPLERLLRLAKASGVRRVAICGSYFCHSPGCGRTLNWDGITRTSAAGWSRSGWPFPSPMMIFPWRCWNCPISSGPNPAGSPFGSFWPNRCAPCVWRPFTRRAAAP